jgi:hypothetical protein
MRHLCASYLFHMLEEFLKCSKELVNFTRPGLSLKLNIILQVIEQNKTYIRAQ